jgi:hypothetical protein
MATRTDSRQNRQRNTLDQLSQNTNLRLDTILNLVNDELHMPLRMTQSLVANRVINIGPLAKQTIDVSSPATIPATEGHQRYRAPAITSASDILFAGGTITIPAVNGGNITTSAGSFTLALSCGVNEYVKILIYYVDGVLRFAQGVSNLSQSLASIPALPSTVNTGGVFVVGYVVVHNTAGTIDNIVGSSIYQYNSGNPLVQDASTTVKGQVNLLPQAFTGLKSFTDGINTDTINEDTLDAGVNVEGILLKDSSITSSIPTLNIGNPLSTANTTNFAHGTTANGVTKDVNIAPNGTSGSTTNVNFGSSISGSNNYFIFKGNKSILVPAGDTASRPGTPVPGMIRYNTDTGVFEHYTSGSWQSIASEAYATAESIKYSIVFG